MRRWIHIYVTCRILYILPCLRKVLCSNFTASRRFGTAVGTPILADNENVRHVKRSLVGRGDHKGVISSSWAQKFVNNMPRITWLVGSVITRRLLWWPWGRGRVGSAQWRGISPCHRSEGTCLHDNYIITQQRGRTLVLGTTARRIRS